MDLGFAIRVMDKHYHPLIFSRLKALFGAGDWDGVQAYLSTLSNAQFRTAGYLIGERLLADADAEVFWEVARRLILWQPKAFTVTIGKAAALKLERGTLSLGHQGFHALSEALKGESHVIDRHKLLVVWLPAVKDYATMESLLEQFGVADARQRAELLVPVDGVTAAFVLLRALRFEEHDRDFLTRVCRALIRRASDESNAQSKERNLCFNLASLLRTYFDLPDLRGTFSLTIEPYELSRIDTDFDVFSRVVTKV